MDRGVGVGVGEALALEVQAPFARLLVDGEKSIDVRGYALSTAKLTPNARVYVLETTRGTPGKSVLADAWTKGGFNPRSRADVARRLREPWFGGDARKSRATLRRETRRASFNCFAKRVYTNFYDYDARAANFTANTLR